VAGKRLAHDARHAAAALQAGFCNENDRNDARGITDLMRVNKYRPVRQCFDC
jgi:transposase